jgi:hypothetical protein
MIFNLICPKCTSWRLQRIRTKNFTDHVLRVLNLGRYQCMNCNWRGIARSRTIRTLSRGISQRYVWKTSVYILLALVGIYIVIFLAATVAGKYSSKDRKDPPPVTKTSPENAVTAKSEGQPSGNPAAPPADGKTDVPVHQAQQAAPVKNKVVIGNRDSRRYHLPGMKYYDRVAAHHRIEFSSEKEAIRAGYRKAPR